MRPGSRTKAWMVRSVQPAGRRALVALEVDSPTGGYLADGFIPVVGRRRAADVSTLLAAA